MALRCCFEESKVLSILSKSKPHDLAVKDIVDITIIT